MKTPDELFQIIKNAQYTKSGDSVDWTIVIDDEDKRVRLVFEESSGKRDWINNLTFPIKPYKDQENTLWLQRGWANAWRTCNDEVCEAYITSLNEHSDYEAEIIGWSYGGAMAQIAGEDISYRTGRKDLILTTFGSPKPLFGRKTKKYVASCFKEAHQYMHRRDCVPLMIPLPGYKMVHKDKIGTWNFFGYFRPNKWHRCYGESKWYDS